MKPALALTTLAAVIGAAWLLGRAQTEAFERGVERAEATCVELTRGAWGRRMAEVEALRAQAERVRERIEAMNERRR